MTASRMSLLGGDAPRAFVVDDEDQHRELLLHILKREGFEVVVSSNGREALEKLRGSDPDIVLLDYMMPQMRGDEVLGQIRASKATARLPVLMLTAIKDADEQVRLIDQGADDFVNKPYEPGILLARVRSLVRMKRLNDETESFENVLRSMTSAVEAKDPYTRGHSERVALIGERLAAEMGLDEKTQLLLRRGGLLHDIGKVAIELSFINKPGKLTDEEFAIMKTHPEHGARICEPLRTARQMIPLIRNHHEKLNGYGYPDGLVEDQIPVEVRIISVADVYDALTTDRPYRKAMPHERALGILKEEVERGAWDPDVVAQVERLGEEAFRLPA